MHPQIQGHYHAILREKDVRPSRALEVGGVMGPKSLLRFPELRDAARYCLNLKAMPSAAGISAVSGNANAMPFEDESFELVMCNATLEHDKRFWLSLTEMKRVLAPGGLLVIGVPAFVRDPERDRGKGTVTYRVHYRFDYYRFSRQAVEDVFFEGMERVELATLLQPPRIIGHGVKPAG